MTDVCPILAPKQLSVGDAEVVDVAKEEMPDMDQLRAILADCKSEEPHDARIFCEFVSNVLDQHDQNILNGIYVDYKSALEYLGNDEEALFAQMDQAVQATKGTRGGFLALLMNPIDDLDVLLKLNQLPTELKRAWVCKHLTAQLERNGVDTADLEFELQGSEAQPAANVESSANAAPTLCFCRSENIVAITEREMIVNPNVPVPDWFRCANFNLHDTNKRFRVLPLLKQHSSKDDVYCGVACSLDEFSVYKKLHEYGLSLKHDSNKLWGLANNFAVQLLRSDSTRTVFEVIMYKERTLHGLLISDVDINDVQKLAQRLDITLV